MYQLVTQWLWTVFGGLFLLSIVIATEFIAPVTRYSVRSRLRGLLYWVLFAQFGGVAVMGLERLWGWLGVQPLVTIPVTGIAGDLAAVGALLAWRRAGLVARDHRDPGRCADLAHRHRVVARVLARPRRGAGARRGRGRRGARGLLRVRGMWNRVKGVAARRDAGAGSGDARRGSASPPGRRSARGLPATA